MKECLLPAAADLPILAQTVPSAKLIFRDSGVSKLMEQQQLRWNAFPFSPFPPGALALSWAIAWRDHHHKKFAFLAMYIQIYIYKTQGIEAENCSAYSWAWGQTCNVVCQPKDVKCVFTQTPCWQLTGFWHHSPTSPGQKCWAENQITSQLHLGHFPSVFKGRGVRSQGRIIPSPSPVLREEPRMESPPGDL